MSAYYDLARIEALRSVMGSEPEAVVRSLLANILAAIERLEAALAGGRLDQAVHPAHAARTDALMLGADPLQSALSELEAAARAQDEPAARAALERLRHVWDPTREELTAAAGPRPDHPRSGTAKPGPKNRILVVDDHEQNLELLERLFELEGHEVRPARSISEAERAISEERPAMIVLDLNLPDGDGLELTRQLKSDGATASIPIVACTAAVTPSDEDRAVTAGCDAFIAKPVDIGRFAATVASMLR